MIVQQTDEFQVGQAGRYVNRLIEIAQEIPVQIHPFHPLKAFRWTLELQRCELVEGEIEAWDASDDFPIEFTDTISWQVQRPVNISNREVIVQRQLIVGKNQILKVDADSKYSDFVVSHVEQFHLFEMPRIDFDLRDFVVVEMELVDLVISRPEPYQSIVRQIEKLQREIWECEWMNAGDHIIADVEHLKISEWYSVCMFEAG